MQTCRLAVFCEWAPQSQSKPSRQPPGNRGVSRLCLAAGMDLGAGMQIRTRSLASCLLLASGLPRLSGCKELVPVGRSGGAFDDLRQQISPSASNSQNRTPKPCIRQLSPSRQSELQETTCRLHSSRYCSSEVDLAPCWTSSTMQRAA